MLCLSTAINAELEFKKVLNDIEFKGVSNPAVLQALQSLKLSTKTGRYLKSSSLHKDIESIYALGYFKAVSAESLILTRNHHLVFHCEENPSIASIAIMPVGSQLSNQLKKRFSAVLNKPFNAVAIDEMRKDIESDYSKAGYDFFKILYIDFNPSTQALEIIINEGLIESLTISGLSSIDEQVVKREMKQQPGKIFNSKTIREDRDKLSRLGYFNSISPPSFEKGSKENNIKVFFHVNEKKVNRVEGGIERDQSQYFVFASLINNHVLLNSDSVATKVETNFDSTQYSIAYRQPWLFNKYKLSSSISLFSKQFEESIQSDITNSLRQGLVLSLRYPITDHLSFETSLKTEDIESTESSSSSLYLEPYAIRSVKANFDYSSIVDRSNPKKGYYWSISYERGNDIGITELGGITFDSFVSSFSTFRALSTKSTLAFRAQYGNYTPNIQGVSTYEDEYFVVGGSNTIRGYNESQYPFTGIKKALMNVEYRYDFTQSFQSVLFYDFGLATDADLEFEYFKRGYGIGFRYITPIGPIRADFSQGEDHFFMHIGLGQVF